MGKDGENQVVPCAGMRGGCRGPGAERTLEEPSMLLKSPPF